MKSDYHLPVLLKESINGLKIDDEGIYVDATFGGGGHSLEILKSLSKKGRLVSFDQDPDSINNSYEESNFYFVNENFKYMKFLTPPRDGLWSSAASCTPRRHAPCISFIAFLLS